MTRLVTDWQGSQTMTKDQALKIAIEALDTLMMEKGSIYQQAINACKQALKENPHGS
jgi:hypothetical protein